MTRFLVLLLLTFAFTGLGAGLALGTNAAAVPAQPTDAVPEATLQIETEPAFLTLLNFDDSSHRVRLETLSASGLRLTSEFHQVAALDALTLPRDLPTDPVTFRTSCAGCATSTFGLAAGQRVLVFIDDPGSGLTVRSDLRVFNEGASTLQGAVRTGPDLGRGRTLLPFDLAPGEDATVGLRLGPGATIELNLTCLGCPSQRILLGDGIDLEVPLR
jgi:hypothetical protein